MNEPNSMSTELWESDAQAVKKLIQYSLNIIF